MSLLIFILGLTLTHVRTSNPRWLISCLTMDPRVHCREPQEVTPWDCLKSRSNGNVRQRFHIIFKFVIRLDRVVVAQTLNTQYGSYDIFTRSYFRRFMIFWNASLDTHSYQSLVIQLLAAIISLLIIPLIVVSQVAVVFSGGSRLMEFNNRGSPSPKLNVSVTFVRCRCIKIWNWFEHIQYNPSRLILRIHCRKIAPAPGFVRLS